MGKSDTELATVRRNGHRGGFTIIESILIVAVFVALGFTIWYFGTRAGEEAGAGALSTDIKTVQNAVAEYLIDSRLKSSAGVYPTDNGRLPESGEYKLIIWTHSYIADGKAVYFEDYFGKGRLPKHWDEGIWRIDSTGKVSVNIDPGDY